MRVHIMVAIAVCCCASCAPKVDGNSDEHELKAQLQLAKDEGLPGTAADLDEMIPKVTADQNAAPIYERIAQKKVEGIPESLAGQLSTAPDEALRKQAREVLKRLESVLNEADEAVKLPHCRFDRKWDHLSIESSPEWIAVSQVARLYSVQGSLAYSEGDLEAACLSLDKAWKLSIHLGEVPNSSAQMFARVIQRRAIGLLASWAINHPESAALCKLLEKFGKQVSIAKPRTDEKMMLVSLLSLIDLCRTDEGRRKLGLRPSDAKAIIEESGITPDKGSPDKIALIKAAREYWKALSLDSARIDAATAAATDKIKKVLDPYPLERYLATQTMMIFSHDYSIDINESIARKLQCIALARSVAGGKINVHIKTEDLVSPWSGVPLGYYADSSIVEIRIERGAGSDPYLLTIKRKEGAR